MAARITSRTKAVDPITPVQHQLPVGQPGDSVFNGSWFQYPSWYGYMLFDRTDNILWLEQHPLASQKERLLDVHNDLTKNPRRKDVLTNI